MKKKKMSEYKENAANTRKTNVAIPHLAQQRVTRQGALQSNTYETLGVRTV